jgi:hypothetical protein
VGPDGDDPGLVRALGVDLGERLGNSVNATSGVALHLFGGLGNLSFQIIFRVRGLFHLESHFRFRLCVNVCEDEAFFIEGCGEHLARIVGIHSNPGSHELIIWIKLFGENRRLKDSTNL